MSRQKSISSKSRLLEERAEKESWLFWLLAALTGMFLLFAPFQTGLFNGYSVQFESPILSSVLWSGILLLLASVFLFYFWKFRDLSDAVSLWVWTIPFAYWLSSFQAASPHLSTGLLLMHVMYATFFVLGVYLSRHETGARWMQRLILLSGYVVMIYGILTLFGNAYSRDAVMLTNMGLRLTSVFQYANAYAALLMAVMLCSLYKVTKPRKWYFTAIHAAMIVPAVLSFLLTLSRGGLVVLPVTLLFVLPLLVLHRQILFLFYLVVAFIAAFPITDSITRNAESIAKSILATLQPDGSVSVPGFSDPLVLKSWLLLLIPTVLFTALVLVVNTYVAPWLERILANWTNKKWSSLHLPGAGLLLGAIGAFLLLSNSFVLNLLPDTIATRVQNINFQQHSVLERATFYVDAVRMIKDYPILGAGGGGWATLYEQYQGNPYTSRQTHNFFLQYLLEVGIIGFLFLTALLAIIFYRYYRNFFKNQSSNLNGRFIFFIMTISILLHSAIDFEMSYAYLAVLVFLSLGGMASTLKSQELRSNMAAWLSGKRRFIFPGLLSVLAVTTIIYTAVELRASNLFQQSLVSARQGAPFQEVIRQMDDALKLDSHHPEYMLTKANILHQVYAQTMDEQLYTEALEIVEELKQYEPFNRQLFEETYSLYTKAILYERSLSFPTKEELENTVEFLSEGLELYPWELTVYERAIAVHTELGWRYHTEGNAAQTDLYLNRAIELRDTVVVKTEQLKELPEGQLQGRDFHVSPSINVSMGKIRFIRGDYAAASELLKQGVREDMAEDPLTRSIARWYIASLLKQGKQDQDIYDKLIQADPNEQAEIERLLQ